MALDWGVPATSSWQADPSPRKELGWSSRSAQRDVEVKKSAPRNIQIPARETPRWIEKRQDEKPRPQVENRWRPMPAVDKELSGLEAPIQPIPQRQPLLPLEDNGWIPNKSPFWGIPLSFSQRFKDVVLDPQETAFVRSVNLK